MARICDELKPEDEGTFCESSEDAFEKLKAWIRRVEAEGKKALRLSVNPQAVEIRDQNDTLLHVWFIYE